MEWLSHPIVKILLIPALTVLGRIFIWNPIAERLSKKKIERLYEKAGEVRVEAPPPAAFAAMPQPQPLDIEVELQRAKLKQVLVGADYAEARHALHKMRDIIDEQRMELATKTSELIVLRQQADENVALKRTVAEWERRYRELTEQSIRLREEYDTKLREGGSDVKPVADDSRNHAVLPNRPFGSQHNAPRPVVPPRIPGRR